MILDPASLQTRVGEEIAVSDWIPVPQEMIDAFAKVTGDEQWIHVDRVRAAQESPFKTTIAHGFLTLSLLAQLHDRTFQQENVAQSINYGLGRVRFPAPVPSESLIRASFRLEAWDSIGPAIQLTWHCVVEVQGQAKPALVAQWLLRHYRKN